MNAPSKQEFCSVCLTKKAQFQCGLCSCSLCKACIEEVDSNQFSYFSKIPAELKKGNCCPQCFEDKVLPHKQRFEDLFEKAQDVYFLTKNYRGYVRVLQKHSKRVAMKECPDRRETILRLAFFAAELGMNAIIDAEVESAKITMGKYQSSTWSGSAVPAQIDGEQLERSL